MKPRWFDDAELAALAERFGTPLFVYRAETMLERARELTSLSERGRGFDVVRFAQKANPNLSLLALLRTAGLAVDAVSAGELQRALAVGYAPEEVLFCADLFDDAALRLLALHPFAVNLGSPHMLEQYARLPRRAASIVLRVNPGFGHGHDRKVATGGALSKHGIWHADVPRTVERARALGLVVSGLHVHIGSGTDLEHLERASAALRDCAAPCLDTLTSLSAGGGLSVPYREGEARVDLERHLRVWNDTRLELERRAGRALALELEPGRYIAAECGVLLTRVRGLKASGGVDYVLVDAGFNNLIRPALYGAFHEISVVGRDGEARTPQVVAGPLCESADVFTQAKGGAVVPRDLPRAQEGDLVCIHDTGAYAAAMASNYNSQLLAAEVLVHNGAARLVRARQTFDQLLGPELECLG